MLYALYAFITVIQFTNGANVLVFWPLPIPSHFRGFEPLFTELAHRGHNVTVVSHFPKSSPVANYTDIAIIDKKVIDESLTMPGTYALLSISSFSLGEFFHLRTYILIRFWINFSFNTMYFKTYRYLRN